MQKTPFQVDGKPSPSKGQELEDNNIEINIVSPSLRDRPTSFNPSNKAHGDTEGQRSKASKKTKKL